MLWSPRTRAQEQHNGKSKNSTTRERLVLLLERTLRRRSIPTDVWMRTPRSDWRMNLHLNKLTVSPILNSDNFTNYWEYKTIFTWYFSYNFANTVLLYFQYHCKIPVLHAIEWSNRNRNVKFQYDTDQIQVKELNSTKWNYQQEFITHPRNHLPLLFFVSLSLVSIPTSSNCAISLETISIPLPLFALVFRHL